MDMRSVGSYPENTRLRVKLVNLNESNWSPRQLAWLQKRQGKTLIGTVENVNGGLYFRPDRCNILVLRDQDMEILGVVRPEED